MNTANSPLNATTGGIAYTVCTIAYLLLSLIILGILQTTASASGDAYLYVTYLIAPVALIGGCALTMFSRGQKVNNAVSFACKPRYYAAAMLMIFGLVFCVSKINYGALELLKLIGYTPRKESSYLPSLEGGLIVPAILAIALLPAAAEEFFFRGLLLSNLRGSVGDVRAILISGFCFSLFHASPEQTVYQFICGCAFALVVVRSGSILPVFAMHFLNNAFVIISSAYGLEFSSTVNLILTISGGVAFAASTLFLILQKSPLKKCQKGEVSKFFIYASAGIAALAIMWVVAFIGA